MKRLLSYILALTTLLCSLSAFAVSAEAATYAEQLKEKGFPDSYVSKLVTLHEKYPNWNFEVFDTDLNWSTAVAGERSSHSKQLIQKQSSLNSGYYCNCSSCYQNDSYVVQEGSSWVSASESAVKYYMDPRNWLTEKYIFQFESTSYDSSQTQSGVESIISSTWMNNANITYTNTSGNSATYKDSNGNTVKYSAAILDAAKSSGMSAYYLASKIVQEVGGSKATAGGVVGTKSPFIGMYNYYNIGAYSTTIEGLEWASGFLKTTAATTLYSTYDSTNKVGSGTTTDVAAGQYMSYISKSGDYYKVRLYTVSGTTYTAGKVGYILKSALRTTYFNYSRPWNNPYKSINGGAAYIAKSFSTYQNSGYLQKFNVNSDSGNLYNHEYMANVQAAAAESVTTYNAYKNADILSASKTFYIPVYKSMPSSACSAPKSTDVAQVTGLKVSSKNATSVTLAWSKAANATGYYVYKYASSTGKYTKLATITSASTVSKKISGLTSGTNYSFCVQAYNSKSTGSKSSKVSAVTNPAKVTGVKLTCPSTTKIKTSWSKVSGNATGYQIYYSRDKKFANIIAKKTISSNSTLSYVGKNFTKGRTYYIKVRAYRTIDGTKYYGSWSDVVTIKCK